ncbi:phage holin family protein [Providencia rettgeri]|uniref:phage holin family protein n=1 Tax=Providencia rettgeri TaxID=587 RepID=UPI002940B9CD|nr:phage holin family protein [Providencia rettgeri]ELR5166292.1 phage holin family protein [Providencia rettgeri]ELR5245711.1 phage holin family protein [Providencia rettgeri]
MFDKEPNSFGLIQWVLLLIISMWGGVVRYISDVKTHKISWSWVAVSMQLVVSGFTGLIGGLGAIESGVSSYLILVSAGVTGAMGTMALDLFWSKYIGGKK